MQVMVYSLVISFAFRLMLRCVLIRKVHGRAEKARESDGSAVGDLQTPCSPVVAVEDAG